MYEKHQGKTGILLWAYSCVKKSDKAKKSSKRVDGTFDEHKKSLSEVDEKYDELRQKHGSKYTFEQLRMWAQMIRLGKHESTDEPPDKPFWCGHKCQQDTTRWMYSKLIISFSSTTSWGHMQAGGRIFCIQEANFNKKM